jgi:hypothetical protein
MPSPAAPKMRALFALMLCLWMSRPGSAEEPRISLDALTSIVRYNESALWSYQGNVRQDEYRLIEIDSAGKPVRVLEQPLHVGATDTEFVHDRTRDEDYRVTMRHHFNLSTQQLSVTTERRNGSYLETLGQTGTGDPKLGIISFLKEAYYLGHSPRNLDAATHMYVLTSGVEQGFYRLSISQSLAKPEYVWPLGTEEVEGYRCLKYAVQVTAPSGRQAYMAYLWLGQDLNYSVVKQELKGMPPEGVKPFSQMAVSGDMTALLENFQWSGNPAMLIVNRKYTKTETGIWVPEITTSYALTSLNPGRLPDPNDRQMFLAANLRDPHTKGLQDCAVKGYHVWTLDMKSLRLNEPIDPNIFEKSIIPEGVPVSNYRLGIHPGDVDRMAQQHLETVTGKMAEQTLDPNAASRPAKERPTKGDRPFRSERGNTTLTRSESAAAEDSASAERTGRRRNSPPDAESPIGMRSGGVWLSILLAMSMLLTAGLWLARRVRRDRGQNTKGS